jgi:hypothetical protein
MSAVCFEDSMEDMYVNTSREFHITAVGIVSYPPINAYFVLHLKKIFKNMFKNKGPIIAHVLLNNF